MLFDLYAPTRSDSHFEVRLRSDSPGPIRWQLGASEVVDATPRIRYRGRSFFRQVLDGLLPATRYRVTATCTKTNQTAHLDVTTLPKIQGKKKLCLGLLPDLHLSLEQATIDDYQYGQRRLTGLSAELTRRYLLRLEELGADAIVLLGDVVDPCTERTLARLGKLLAAVKIPIHPIIGNHEPWSPGGQERFHRALNLPGEGYYTVTYPGLRLVFLSTPDPDALGPRSAQLGWLEEQLTSAAPDQDILVFSHFSLVLHPAVTGLRNDGYQLLSNHRAILELLRRYPKVRLFSAGHKNVPSRVVTGQLVHLLTPQLIQAPCGFDLVHLSEGGFSRLTYEIDEQHYVEVARAAYEHEWSLRYGDEPARNFAWAYPTPTP